MFDWSDYGLRLKLANDVKRRGGFHGYCNCLVGGAKKIKSSEVSLFTGVNWLILIEDEVHTRGKMRLRSQKTITAGAETPKRSRQQQSNKTPKQPRLKLPVAESPLQPQVTKDDSEKIMSRGRLFEYSRQLCVVYASVFRISSSNSVSKCLASGFSYSPPTTNGRRRCWLRCVGALEQLNVLKPCSTLQHRSGVRLESFVLWLTKQMLSRCSLLFVEANYVSTSRAAGAARCYGEFGLPTWLELTTEDD